MLFHLTEIIASVSEKSIFNLCDCTSSMAGVATHGCRLGVKAM